MEEKQEQEICGANTASELPIAGPDREVWVRNQVFTAMRMAIALKFQIECGADETAYIHGLEGIANGAATEILNSLGFARKFTNLRKAGYAAAKMRA